VRLLSYMAGQKEVRSQKSARLEMVRRPELYLWKRKKYLYRDIQCEV
jgi:hypothetical protein